MAARLVDRDLGFKAFMRAADSLRGGSYAKVGVLADDSKGGLHVPGCDLTVAEIAAVQEFGTENGSIPSRPFLRRTFDAQREELAKIATRCVLLILDSKLSAGNALNILGAKLAAETKKTITTTPLPGVLPENSPTTKLLKVMKGKTARLFRPTSKTFGGQLGDVVATDSAIKAAGGRAAWLLSRTGGIRAARTLGESLAQIGALASVRTLVDTGRMVNAITWIVVMGSFSQGTGAKTGGSVSTDDERNAA